MITNRLIVRALVVLGFGSVVGLGTGCSAMRGSRSRTTDGAPGDSRTAPAPDTVTVFEAPVSVMYGVAPAPFDPGKPVPQREIPARENGYVHGRVTDEKGEPLRGVQVLVAFTSIFDITDEDGRYEIAAVTGDSIWFDYMGFQQKGVVVGKRKTINVRLKEDWTALDDIIRLAYGPWPVPFDRNKKILRDNGVGIMLGPPIKLPPVKK
ncbi:MAG: carboxypeptidase-like regulatory domain-containing protein [Alistipes sp.]|jgi:hypothetical protein|nr:carboxypeptidase-like regulatory domain-containing protein [Alistipes sp.]